MATMDNYERQRFDAVADGLAKTSATLTNIQQQLDDHMQREERDRAEYSEDRLELAKAMTAMNGRLDTLTSAVKLHTTELKSVVSHIEGCRINRLSNTKLVGIVAGASSVISAFVSAAAWAAQHYKG